MAKGTVVYTEQLTPARGNFDWLLNDDINALLAAHDAHMKGVKGRPKSDIEVFKRASLVMIVTGWESFLEDTIENCFVPSLNLAKTPDDVRSAFNAVAHTWIDNKPKPPDLAKWCGDGWKSIVKARMYEELASLHTPNSANVKALSKRYLAQDVTLSWKWRGVTPRAACKKLDELISLRGELVHRAREWPSKKGRRANVTRKQVVDGFELVKRLVHSTEVALGVEPRGWYTSK